MGDIQLALQQLPAENNQKAAPQGASIAEAIKAAQSAPPPPPPAAPTLGQRIAGDVGSALGAAGTFGQTALEGLGQYGGGILRAAESVPGEIAAHPVIGQAARAAQEVGMLPGGANIVDLMGSPPVVNAAEAQKGITQAMIQQSQDRAAALGLQHPVAGFLGQFTGQNLPAAVGGVGLEKLGGKLLPPAENKIVDFLRRRLINAGTGMAIGGAQPTGDVGQNIQAGAVFGPLAGAGAEAASWAAPYIVSRAAALTSPTIRKLIAGAKLMSFMEGKTPITGDAGPNLRLSIGQLTGDPNVLQAEAAVRGASKQGEAAALERVSQNNIAIRDHLTNLTDSMLTAEPGTGIQQAANNLRQSLVDLKTEDSAREDQLWNDFRENNPGVGFHAPSLQKAMQTTMQSDVEPVFQKEVTPLLDDISDRLDAAQERYGDVVPFSTVKDLRTILLNKIRDTTDGNYRRVAGKLVNVLHNYVTDPNKLVVEGNLPISNELMVKRNVMNDFNAARQATQDFHDTWGDNGLNDFVDQRGQQGDQEFTQGLNRVSTLLSPQRPDLTDYTLNALSRTPGGTQSARDWFGYNFLKNVNGTTIDSEGRPVIDTRKAADWLAKNMDTAKRIFNAPSQHELLDGIQSFFRRASRASSPNMSQATRTEILHQLGMQREVPILDRFLMRGTMGHAISGSGQVSDLMNTIPPDSYVGIVADALNDPEFAQQLMRNANASKTMKLAGLMQKYAPAAATGMTTGIAVHSLPPNQGQP